MRTTIIEKLRELEQQQHIKILYACESGSRAWGFASPDSDFEVRFIYARKAEEYLSIAEVRDVIEMPINEVLDIGGWDIKKALKLFLKSNSPLYEWLQSPIVYFQDDGFASELQTLMPKYFSLRAGASHYLSMTINTFQNDLQSDEVKLKKYFYAIRPILACKWIVEKLECPPIKFGILRTLITENDVQNAIDDLMERKSQSAEKAFISPVTIIDKWLIQAIEYCKLGLTDLKPEKHTVEELNTFFRKYIQK